MPFNEKGEFIRDRRSGPSARAGSRRQWRELLLGLAAALLAVALLVGVIWIVVVFHRWIGIALGLLMIRCLSNLLR